MNEASCAQVYGLVNRQAKDPGRRDIHSIRPFEVRSGSEFDDVYVAVHRGSEVTYNVDSYLGIIHPPESKVFFLGSGVKGGSVFRVEMPTGESFIVKHYMSDEYLQKDLQRFQILRSAYESPGPADVGKARFQVAPYEQFSKFTLKSRDLRGTSLRDFLKQFPEHKELYTKLRKGAYENLVERLGKKYRILKVEPEEFIYIQLENGEEVVFRVSDVNLLVDSESKQLVIIDPY